MARVARVLAFHGERARAAQPRLRGLHFDVEPHTEEAWQCGSAAERRDLVRTLQSLFARLVGLARAEDPALAVSAALPWWLGPLSAEVPEAAPARWLEILDEVVLMVYGNPGGPVVGGSAEAVLRRVDDTRLWAALPAGRGLRVGLATYEYRDAAALQEVLGRVDAVLGARRAFRGLAVFAHGGAYDAPLSAILEGRVVDSAQRPLPGARVQAAGRSVAANRCGRFVVRDLPRNGVELTADAEGFAPRRVRVQGLVPGRLRHLPPIVLERRPSAARPGS